MKLGKPENVNYCATVVKIKNIIPLDNCDNVVATTIFGFQAIISKDTAIGTLGIVFPVETQLSHEYCSENNLYRHAEYNVDPEHKGYIEDNRRVKAVKFRGHTSNALFMSLSSVAFAGVDIEDLKEGDEFDKIGDHLICKKYVVPVKAGRGNGQVAQYKVFTRVDTRFMPEHFSTENYFRNDRNIDPEQEIIVTQKLHGTSVRIGNTIVKRKLSLLEKLARLVGVEVKTSEYDYVYGSRRVIKDSNNPDHKHYYDTDIWTTKGKELIGSIPEGFILYAEIIGWTQEGKAIQTSYHYMVPAKDCKLYVYRIAFVNEKGLVTDLGWDQIKEFCSQRGILYVPELWRGKHKDFKPLAYLDKQLFTEFATAIRPGEDDIVDEGVCIRVDNRITPAIFKAKSPKFFEHETKLLDKGEEDMESAEVEEVV